MFGRNKDHSGLPSDLYEFLQEADKLYIKAFETRSIGLLKDYFTRDCCFAISRWILAEASSRYFSDEKFRRTTWTILNQSPTEIILQKDCTYKDIRLTISRSMKVSDDYKEIWRLNVSPEEYWVASVELTT
jgi:hypothetical protein